MRIFDAAIVYSSASAQSAGNAGYAGRTPFAAHSAYGTYNAAYAFFLEECRRSGITALFTTSSDIIGPGTFSCYWIYADKKWTKVRTAARAHIIFDKFTPVSVRTKAIWKKLFSSPSVRQYNDPRLMTLFNDKLASGIAFAHYAVPTVRVTASRRSIRAAITDLRALTALSPTPEDFTSDIIVKDRHGAGGERIFKVTADYTEAIYSLLTSHKQYSFVLQPFLNFTKGFTYRNITTATDIRLIYHNGALIQTYIRRAKKHDFRCNSHQGATSTYITAQDIPLQVSTYASRIMRDLLHNPSLFTLDFAISDSGRAYFLEGNISPGLYWDPGSKTEARMSQNLITEIVTEIAVRTQTSRRTARIHPIPATHSLRAFRVSPVLS